MLRRSHAPGRAAGGPLPASCTLRRYVDPPARTDPVPDLPPLDATRGVLHPVRHRDSGVSPGKAARPRPRGAAGSHPGPPPRRRRLPARVAGRRGARGSGLPIPALPARARGRAGAPRCRARGRGATRRQHPAGFRRATGRPATGCPPIGPGSCVRSCSAARACLQAACRPHPRSGPVARARASCPSGPARGSVRRPRAAIRPR